MPYVQTGGAALPLLAAGGYQPRRRVELIRGGAAGFGLGVAREVFGSLAVSTATPILTGALASSAASTAAATGLPAAILGMSPALAVPVIGAAMVGVTIAVVALLRASRGCGETCVQTSQWANEAEQILKENLATYLALPAPRSVSARNTAASNFNVVWARLSELCGNPQLGDAGRRCIADRQRGACKWRDSAGECFNWFTGYLDPIQNDTNVAEAAGLPGGLDLGFSGDPSSLLPAVAIVALLAIAAFA